MAARQLSDGNDDGTVVGQDATDKVGFYGKTPIAQRAGAAQATSLVSATSYSSAHNAALVEIMDTLTAAGIWKGSA